MTTNTFAKVSAMNEAFGNPRGNPLAIDWVKLEKQAKNIGKEVQELLAAIAARDVEETRDAFCDIIVFTAGGQHLMGVDGNADMDAVLEGVYSRFCQDEDDLDATKAHYDALGVTYYVEGEFPTVCLKSDKDQCDDEYPLGKFLKSISYRKAVFSHIVTEG